MAQLQSCFLRVNEKKKKDEVGESWIADTDGEWNENKNEEN